MAQVVTQSISVSDSVTEQLTLGTTTVNAQVSSSPTYSFDSGTGSGAIDLHFEHSYTLAASASTTLVLSGLTDDLGRTVAFARIKRLSVWITAKTSGDTLVVGNAASNPVTSFTGGGTQTWVVRDYDLKLASGSTGFAVTSGSADQLKIANAGSNSMTFLVSITGTHA